MIQCYHRRAVLFSLVDTPKNGAREKKIYFVKFLTAENRIETGG